MNFIQRCYSYDKDCLEDLEVIFESGSQNIIDNASYVKCKCAEVVNVFFSIEPVPFNKGFYSIDITYLFKITLEAYKKSCVDPETVSGKAQFCKKVILYGSDGTAKRFDSEDCAIPATKTCCCCCVENLPKASVQVAEPVILDAKLVSKPPHCCDCCTKGDSCPINEKKVFVTLGLFSIVQLQRPVPLLIPCYDYCIPQKECSTSNDSPCELFEKIKFPTSEFFPPSLEDVDDCKS